MTIRDIESEARKLCRHSVVFEDATDILVAVRGMQGRSTKAIARELHITPSQAQYRITKAQNSMGTRFRADYRNGRSELSNQMLKATEQLGIEVVRKRVAPKFVKHAAPKFVKHAALGAEKHTERFSKKDLHI